MTYPSQYGKEIKNLPIIHPSKYKVSATTFSVKHKHEEKKWYDDYANILQKKNQRAGREEQAHKRQVKDPVWKNIWLNN